MTIEIDKIYRLDRILGEIARLHRERESLLAAEKPTIEELANVYKSVYADYFKADRSRIFIFVALYLHDPGALTGRRMGKNIRRRIATALNLANPETISMRARNLLFHYMTYRNFREDIENFAKYI